MNTGRELDALVAEKVMGMPKALVGALALGPMAYSTEMAAAWLVVERVWAVAIPKTRYGVYRFQLNRLDYGSYVCEFATDADGDFSTHSVGEGNTAPLAICRAALNAIDAKVSAVRPLTESQETPQ